MEKAPLWVPFLFVFLVNGGLFRDWQSGLPVNRLLTMLL